MEHALPVSYSKLEPQALVNALWQDYQLSDVTDCYLLKFGLNDHYVVTTFDGDYILRVYHHGWRTEEDIAYELTMLAFLDTYGAPVCAPIIRRDGTYYRHVLAPEGPRAVALFPFAAGSVPDPSKDEDYHLYGQGMALVHQYSDRFTCQHHRFSLDLDHLTFQPLMAMLPYLTHRPDDIAFVKVVVEGVRTGLQTLADGIEWGYCHGDFHGGNSHIDTSGKLLIFDFDCGGPGWRAYDLAVCRWGGGKADTAWKAFCRGYESVREITATTYAAIPWFIIARQIWFIGLHTRPSSQLPGRFWLDDNYFDRQLGTLRELLTQHLPDLANAV